MVSKLQHQLLRRYSLLTLEPVESSCNSSLKLLFTRRNMKLVGKEGSELPDAFKHIFLQRSTNQGMRLGRIYNVVIVIRAPEHPRLAHLKLLHRGSLQAQRNWERHSPLDYTYMGNTRCY